MAPSEEAILQSFLLQSAGVRDVLTLPEFASLFPQSKRVSPLVRYLYRDLQLQRNAICDSIVKQIHLECRLGEALLGKRWAAKNFDLKKDKDLDENKLEAEVSSFYPSFLIF